MEGLKHLEEDKEEEEKREKRENMKMQLNWIIMKSYEKWPKTIEMKTGKIMGQGKMRFFEG